MEFVTGGLAAVCATLFTNPLEVVKTRLQLQGELKARGRYTVHYRGFLHAASAVLKAEGPLALQKGLVPGLWFQLVFNGTRLGLYQLAENSGLTVEDGKLSLAKSSLAAAAAGCCGSIVASPFYLVKTHLQAQAADSVAVGHQHQHTSMTHGLWTIYKEHGVAGLWRGVVPAMQRTTVGSTIQLLSFGLCKQRLDGYQVFHDNLLLKTFASSLIGGTAVSVCMTPFDVVTTRLYNQGVDAEGKGLLYRGTADCFLKIWSTEGIYGFYKGFVPSYARLCPHTVLCLVFWDLLKDVERKIFRSRTAKQGSAPSSHG